ncbi:c-type cytochrome [Pontibaca methylaminivorans]|uniref:c-type cytochrome n=1 Tax=Pontibaca methylaminivorans TaxID=515897 RepID=UPI002FDB5A5B
MNTMTVTKAAAGVIGAFLVLLLGAWAAQAIYHVESPGDPAYAIDTGDEGENGDEGPGASFADLLAEADPDAGERVFRKCVACHKLEPGANGTGPSLYGVVGREVAHEAGFNYSSAMADHGGVWTPELLSDFLVKPSDEVPGTAMSFAGLPKDTDRANVIAFLNTHSDEPIDLAAAAGGDAGEGEAAADEAEDTGEASDEAAADESGDEATEEETGDAATDDAAAEDEAADAAADEGAADEGAADEAATDEAATEDAAAADEAVEEDASADSAAEEDAAGEEAGAEDTAAAAAGSSLLADADMANGEKVFKKCAVCHKLAEGENVVGPSLHAVVGRDVASVDGFRYSNAMQEYGGEWTPERLDDYLANPRDAVPGTSMSFAGLRKEQDRIDVIGYLESVSE